MSASYEVSRLTTDAIATFWEQSPHATAFNHPAVLATLSAGVEWYGVTRSRDLVAAWPICRAPEGPLQPPDFSYFVGPMFAGMLETFKYHRRVAVQHQALEALIAEVAEIREPVRASLPVGLHDLRPWLWWNRAQGSAGEFLFVPRYTARITGLDAASDDDLLAAMDRSRRQRVIAGGQYPADRVDDWTDEEVLTLADDRFLAREPGGGALRRAAVARVLHTVRQGRGEVLAFRHRETGALASALVLLYGPREANNVLSVSTDDARAQDLTNWTIWEAVRAARSAGKTIFDFNGANSPLRASPKHAFGAEGALYFDMEFRPGRPTDGTAPVMTHA